MNPNHEIAPGIGVREAKAEDVPALVALLSVLDVGEDRPLSASQARRIFDAVQRYPRYHIYVAEHQGRIIATLALLLIDSLAHGGAPHAVVEDVAVHPDYQRKGLGRALMHFAMERCREAGCYKVALSSLLQREGAHRFYESLGFEKHGFSFVVRSLDA